MYSFCTLNIIFVILHKNTCCILLHQIIVCSFSLLYCMPMQKYVTFIHFTFEVYLDSFCFQATINCASMNVLIHIFQSIYIDISVIDILNEWTYQGCICSVQYILQNNFPKQLHQFLFPPTVYKISNYPKSSPTWYCLFFIVAILVGM